MFRTVIIYDVDSFTCLFNDFCTVPSSLYGKKRQRVFCYPIYVYRYIIIILQLLIICVPSVFARTVAVWYASDEMYVTAIHYIEAELEAGSTICLTDSPLETGKVDVLYVIGHGWRESSSGGVTVYVDGIERRLPFKVLLSTAIRCRCTKIIETRQ